MSTMDTPDSRRTPWRLIGWSVPVVLLLVPLVAGFPWTPSDYVIMGVLLGDIMAKNPEQRNELAKIRSTFSVTGMGKH